MNFTRDCQASYTLEQLYGMTCQIHDADATVYRYNFIYHHIEAIGLYNHNVRPMLSDKIFIIIIIIIIIIIKTKYKCGHFASSQTRL